MPFTCLTFFNGFPCSSKDKDHSDQALPILIPSHSLYIGHTDLSSVLLLILLPPTKGLLFTPQISALGPLPQKPFLTSPNGSNTSITAFIALCTSHSCSDQKSWVILDSFFRASYIQSISKSSWLYLQNSASTNTSQFTPPHLFPGFKPSLSPLLYRQSSSQSDFLKHKRGHIIAGYLVRESQDTEAFAGKQQFICELASAQQIHM